MLLLLIVFLNCFTLLALLTITTRVVVTTAPHSRLATPRLSLMLAARTDQWKQMQFPFIVCRRRELFQIKSLTWLLDRTLLVGDSRDRPNKDVVFDLPTARVRDLCERAARREMETGREQVLAIDLDTDSYTHSCVSCVMKSVTARLNPNMRISVVYRPQTKMQQGADLKSENGQSYLIQREK